MKPALARVVHVSAVAVVALQAMALATRYFQPWLDGDYLLPERFAADVLAGTYPLSGWTLSSSPYLFPDLALSVVWRTLLGDLPLLPYYVVMSYVSLALIAGWSLQRVLAPEGTPVSTEHGGSEAAPRATGWIAGALIVNLLLAWQGFADHARWLWWLGTATFHGGAVLIGMAQFALWAGPPETTPSRRRFLCGAALLFLGLVSDTLLLTQFVAPLAMALWATAPGSRWRAPRFRSFLGALFLAYLLVLMLRGALLVADWWNFPNVVRYAPTPSAVAATAARMAADLAGPVAAAIPGFLALGLSATALAIGLSARGHRQKPFSIERRQAGFFASLGLLNTSLLPVVAVYWQNPQHGRYLLPCLVLPLWWLVTTLPPSRLRSSWPTALIAIGLVALAAWRVPAIDFSRWAWPYPDRVAALDSLLAPADRGRVRGLADFWHANYLNAVSRSLNLNQLRPDGRVQFWGNNAFHHYDSAPDGTELRIPAYSFIVTNGLDPAALRTKFGEPARAVSMGEYEVWLYDEPAARRIGAVVDSEVRAFLRDRPGTARIAAP